MMAYKRPTDLPRVPAMWESWPLEERIRAAMALPARLPIWARLSAVAVTLNEQPGKIPVGNCCGLMCQGEHMPWGWLAAQWTEVRPIGYALLNEGQGVNDAPFLAFAKPEDSLLFLADRCEAREIRTGLAYAKRWVSANESKWQSTAEAYNAAYERAVSGLWALAAKYAALPMTGGQG